jgi:hypothetical protein
MIMYYLFRSDCILGGAQSGRSETAVSVELTIRHFSGARKRILFSLIEFQKERYLLSGVG